MQIFGIAENVLEKKNLRGNEFRQSKLWIYRRPNYTNSRNCALRKLKFYIQAFPLKSASLHFFILKYLILRFKKFRVKILHLEVTVLH